MKFDIVRAWKDEIYRESLGEEQLSLLPANPAGELTDADLEAIHGGGLGVGSSHIHSFAVLCDISVFTLNINIIGDLIPILSPNNNVCAESH